MEFFSTKEYQNFKHDLDLYNNEEYTNLQVIVEDEPTLILELNNMYIYFLLEHAESDKIRLTYHKFDSKLNKKSETRITFSDYSELLEKTINVIEYNIKKDKRF